MKRVMLLACLFNAIQAMEKQVACSNPITSEETACFEWFDKQTVAREYAYKQLTKDQMEWITFTKYKEHPLAVTNAINSMVDHFFKYAKENKISIDYTPSFLKATILNMKIAMQNMQITKPTDELSARMYVFTQKLSREEQLTMSKEVYLTDRQKTITVVEKLAYLLAEEMAKLNLISDHPAPKKEYAERFIAKKIADLDAAYKPKTSDIN